MLTVKCEWVQEFASGMNTWSDNLTYLKNFRNFDFSSFLLSRCSQIVTSQL